MVNSYQVVKTNNIDVWCVPATGVINSGEVFRKLESKLSTLKGRKFYGALLGSPEEGVYRACVAKKLTDNFKGLEGWAIPGGKYLRAKIKDWEKHLELIGPTFKDMTKGQNVDNSRPYIEFYRSQKKLILLLPIY